MASYAAIAKISPNAISPSPPYTNNFLLYRQNDHMKIHTPGPTLGCATLTPFTTTRQSEAEWLPLRGRKPCSIKK
jgi:hypothetical protein